MKHSKGFTLIELMLVVVIISILASMVAPRLAKRGEEAKVSAAKADIQANMPIALDLYTVDNGEFPTTEQGLEALNKKPSTPPYAKNWRGPYLKKKPVDPWGNTYQYRSPGIHREDYDLYSFGKDGQEGNDDITSWEEDEEGGSEEEY